MQTHKIRPVRRPAAAGRIGHVFERVRCRHPGCRPARSLGRGGRPAHRLTASSRDQVDALGHGELGPVLVALRQVQARCDALILATIREVDARGTFTLDGALTTTAWDRSRIHPTPAAASRLARTARALRGGTLPNTEAALAAGSFGATHAAIITDGVTDAPAEAVALIEADIVDLASETDESGTANLMRAFGHALDPDAADEKATSVTTGPGSPCPPPAMAGSASAAPPTRSPGH